MTFTAPSRVEDVSFDELRAGFTASVSHELGRRWPGSSCFSTRPISPGRMPALLEQARAEVQNAGELIDEILFLSELESGHEVVSLGSRTRCRCSRRSSRSSLERCARGRRAPRRRRRVRRPAAAAEDAPDRRREPGGERDPLRRTRRDVHPRRRAGARGDAADRDRRRDRRLRSRPRAPLRALLAGRRSPRHARHGPRARDREARRRRGRRDGRGDRQPRRRAADRLLVPG